MHSKRNRLPRWSILNVILLIAVGGLILAHHLHLTPTDHKLVLLLSIPVIYGLIGWWVKSNAAELQDLDDVKYQKQRRDPAVYGTAQFPTRTQAHFKHVTSFYHHESPNKQEKA